MGNVVFYPQSVQLIGCIVDSQCVRTNRDPREAWRCQSHLLKSASTQLLNVNLYIRVWCLIDNFILIVYTRVHKQVPWIYQRRIVNTSIQTHVRCTVTWAHWSAHLHRVIVSCQLLWMSWAHISTHVGALGLTPAAAVLRPSHVSAVLSFVMSEIATDDGQEGQRNEEGKYSKQTLVTASREGRGMRWNAPGARKQNENERVVWSSVGLPVTPTTEASL